MKILKSIEEVPRQIAYRGHIYKKGAAYGNLEQARREKRYFEAKDKNISIHIKNFYIQPMSPFPYYVLYVRRVN
jgi:hypothetical protein